MSDLGPTQRDAAERIIVGLSAALTTARAEARKAALEEAAELIEKHTISFGATNQLRPRLDGDKASLEYATAIRALIEHESKEG